jgi:aryl-alcohol dehydrogenase-like predicted oxidoreductase
VGQLVLGTAKLSLSGTRHEAFALLDAFVDIGGEIIDTAAVYNDWVPGEVRRAEGILGERRRGRPRAKIFIATKGAHPPLSDMSRLRLDAASITDDVELSLSRRGVEQLDLFYLHRDDPRRPVEAILESLARLVEGGKIAAAGRR